MFRPQWAATASPRHSPRFGRKGSQNTRNQGAGKTLWQLGCRRVYICSVKKSQISRSNPAKSTQARGLQRLKRYLRELRAIHCEAIRVLDRIRIDAAVETVRGLCRRFYILQEYFVMRYHEAMAHAISVLGHAQAALYLTGFPVANLVAFA